MLVLQLMVLLVFLAGPGYAIWRWVRRPAPLRAATWVWCGLAGFCLAMLFLQALCYAGLPLRRTVAWAALAAAAGVVALLRHLWRQRREVRRHWREVACLLGAGLGAAAMQSASVATIGPDRFLGEAQVDHANYVFLAQFLIDEPHATTVRDIGLRPWLVRPVQMKEGKFTSVVPVAVAAVASGTDAQRAWGATGVFYCGLLALAVAGLWRVVLRLRPWQAAVLGLVGGVLPIVSYVFLIGFFAQLATLFVFPALIALAWPGAFPRRLALFLLIGILGFLAGAYTEFWPIGVGVAGMLLLGWRVEWKRKLLWGAALVAGSVVVTGAYAWRLPQNVLYLEAIGPTKMSGFARDGISWRGIGRIFYHGDNGLMVAAGLMAVAGVVAAVLLSAPHRRWRWAAALAAPCVLGLAFVLRPVLPVYMIYKLIATFSPVAAGLAVIGWSEMGQRSGTFVRRGLAAGGVVAVLAAMACGPIRHFELIATTRGANRDPLDRLWAARERVELTPAERYLIDGGNFITAAWLAYFARYAEVYYTLPAVSDRRAPSESYAFRRIPAGVSLTWLDLVRTGPVPAREASPAMELGGARSTFELLGQTAHLLERETRITITRQGGYPPEEAEWMVHAGVSPLPGVGMCEVTFSDGDRVLAQHFIERAQILRVPVRLKAGRQEYTLRVEPQVRGAQAASSDGVAVLQALSLEAPGDFGW
jgi:hypothetical protein